MIKIGVFGDLHGKDPSEIINVFNYKKVDLILANGDFISCKNKNLKKILKSILSNSNSKVIVIPGNYEGINLWNKTIKSLKKKYDNLIDNHKKKFKFKNYNIVSYGGGMKKAECVRKIFKIRLNEIKKLSKKIDKNTILQLHEPPKYYGDIACFRREKGHVYPTKCGKRSLIDHIGNEWFTELIEGKFGNPIPKVVIAGHVHECRRFQSIPTKRIVKSSKHLFVNPGAAIDGEYAIVEINKRKAKVLTFDNSNRF